MREMLLKLPEGDWLCEECKLAEETENWKQGKSEIAVRIAIPFFNLFLKEHFHTVSFFKIDFKGSDAEEKKMHKTSTQNSGKRHAETIEVTSASKRPAIETSLGSPKSSSPSRIAALSRDSSFKSLDKGKVKPAHQTSFGNLSSIDIPEIARSSSTGPRLQTPKGKKNSFIVSTFCLYLYSIMHSGWFNLQ